ncbi:hypothetical protein WA026_006237 [Henosepilachna vigintioctopunctata]|uniref:C2H2-type domain-containing protein n=1 Tax=Henosepilachna vigintioctopunctata TaxID=420089 RepID=A0AAW1TJS4_9CUCU
MKFPSNEFVCSECKDNFQSASSLLKHFASHAIETSTNDKVTEIYSEMSNCEYVQRPQNRKVIPDLHPIGKNTNKNPRNIFINPLIFCEATLNENDHSKNQFFKKNSSELKVKKYKCTYCQKQFGWSTDLKRHTLIHTGERPYKCKKCSLTFTRNFLLQKHLSKIHNFNKSKIPDLKPIYLFLDGKMKKSYSLPRKQVQGQDSFLNNNFFGILENPLY